MTQAPTERRTARPQAVLTVQGSQWLSPNVVRIEAGGPGFDALQLNDFTDKYVKIIFADPSLNLTPPYDLAALRDSLPAQQRPVTRTYTVRRADPEQQRVVVDFVVHGSEGIAGPWAANAQPGDTLTLTGAGGGFAPDPSRDWHLFVGDESALPAISAALDALPGDARGVAYLETLDRDHNLHATVPAAVDVVWIERDHPGSSPELLAAALENGRWPAGSVGVFAHGERESMKAVRAVLKARDIGSGKLSLSGYWAHGRSEDRFQAEKREPIGRIDG